MGSAAWWEACVLGGWLTPYHSQDILLVSGQLRWKIELIHACVILQVGFTGRAALTDKNAEKSGRSYARERPLNVSYWKWVSSAVYHLIWCHIKVTVK